MRLGPQLYQPRLSTHNLSQGQTCRLGSQEVKPRNRFQHGLKVHFRCPEGLLLLILQRIVLQHPSWLQKQRPSQREYQRWRQICQLPLELPLLCRKVPQVALARPVLLRPQQQRKVTEGADVEPGDEVEDCRDGTGTWLQQRLW